ncbi:MAG: ABC transporter substrate-binding protein [Thermoleophilia bacterium]
MRRGRLTPLAALAALVALLAIVAAGCGGDDEAAPPAPAPSEPAPAEPAPSEPAPAEPAPAEPAPSEPAPAEPAPTEPAPAEPAPSEPAPPADAGDRDLVVLVEDVAPGLDTDGVNGSHFGVHQILENTMEGLVEYPSILQDGILQPNYKVTEQEFQPRLATSWSSQPGPDGKSVVWTITLRPGIKSCVGNEFTADDVVWTFARAKSVSGASPVAWFLGNVSNVLPLDPLTMPDDPTAKELKGEVVKIDDYTVQVTQFQAGELFPRVLEIFALYPFDSKEVQAHATEDDPWAHQWTDTEGSAGFGAYCIASWTKGQEFVLEANPNYYRGEPQFTKVTLRKVPQSENRVAAVQQGDADIVTALSPQEIAALRKDDNVRVYSWFNNEILALGFNFALEPWNTPEGKLLRQAIAYAMPVQEIVDNDFLGDAKPWYGLSESSFYAYKPIETYATQDLEKAKSLLAEAGFPEGDGLDKYKDALTLHYVAERQSLLEPIANRIKTALGQVGIEITLSPISAQEYNDRELTKRDMPMFLRDLVRPFGPDVGYTTLLFYVSTANGGLVNAGNYVNDTVDQEFFASQATVGEERLGHLETVQDVLMDDLPLVPIVERPSQIVMASGIACWQTSSSNIIGLWYITTSDQECTDAAKPGSVAAETDAAAPADAASTETTG